MRSFNLVLYQLFFILFSVLTARAVINVHIVPHTHDDVGWLKTVDQYFYGANTSIQHAGVQYILDSVIPALEQNSDRKFIYVEQAFFWRWWRQQTDDMHARVKTLVSNGQLEFINGGWCMHDEAATHYVAMIDQTTLGHRFLKETFGITPKTGWQIDPFGHSATQAALLSAEVGFEGLYFARIDYQDDNARRDSKTLEMIWRASASLGSDAQVFTGAFQTGGYGPPDGFCYDIFCEDDPIRDDENLEDYNVNDRVEAFVQDCQNIANDIADNNIILTMGSDFQHENANEWFKNLDKLIKYANEDGRVNAFYSTPTEYTLSKFASNLTWTVKTDDFFPYADCESCFWTGYFTSRALLKRYERVTSAYLQAARQLEALAGYYSGDGSFSSSQLFSLEEASGIAQHHDAVSGTSKQHVAYDYAYRLSKGYAEAADLVQFAIGDLAFNCDNDCEFGQCPLLNVSVCDATTSDSALSEGGFVVVAYNPLARTRSEKVQIPISLSSANVFDENGDSVLSQIVETNSSPDDDYAPYTLIFEISNIDPLSTKVYTVMFDTTSTSQKHKSIEKGKKNFKDDEFVIENDHISLSFSSTTGRLTGMSNKDEDVTIELDQGFAYYIGYGSPGLGNRPQTTSELKAMTGPHLHHRKQRDSHPIFGLLGDSGQPSGAYIFRPDVSDAEPTIVGDDGTATVEIIEGSVVTEVRQTFDDWASQIIRLYNDANYVEIEWTVGPVPIDDNFGKEIISRFTTSIESNKTFYTDSNGREFLERIRDYRPTWDYVVNEEVAGNFYPVNAAMYIKDLNAQLTILTDRSEAGGSINDGQIELMVHRRLLADDWRGVGEPMNETEGISSYDSGSVRYGEGITVRGTHRLYLNKPETAMSYVRDGMEEIFSSSLLAFGTLAYAEKSKRAETRKVSLNLPENINLMTFQQWDESIYLVRLAHKYAVGEDEELSQDTTVDLADLFNGLSLNIESAYEMGLSANQLKTSINHLQWDTTEASTYSYAYDDGDFEYTISPMQIKTFLVTATSA